MRDKRISLLLIISFILIFASFVALGILGYNFYRKVDKAMVMQAPADKIRDSLLIVYSQTIKALEQKLGATLASSDSLENNLSNNLDEYYRTRDELMSLITNPRNDSDFEVAKLKIDELQYRMAALRKTNQDIEADNKKLYTVLDQIRKQTAANNSYVQTSQPVVQPRTVKTTTPPTPTVKEDEIVSTSVTEPAPVAEVVKPAPKAARPQMKFSTDNLRLERVVSRNNENMVELIGSFTLFNTTPDQITTDLMIVVTKPDGKVLQKSNWESGAFNTEHGRKIYSYKMRIEQGKGEVKQLTFSLLSDKNDTGNYTFQIYHNGFQIGRATQKV